MQALFPRIRLEDRVAATHHRRDHAREARRPGIVNVSIKDAIMPPLEDERQRTPFTGGWFRHAEMVTFHYYDDPFSWSLCHGDYACSIAIMQRDDGSSPYCCTGCVIE